MQGRTLDFRPGIFFRLELMTVAASACSTSGSSGNPGSGGSNRSGGTTGSGGRPGSGGATGSGGGVAGGQSGGGGGSTSTSPLPGDVAKAAGTHFVAAHAMRRALIASYDGPLLPSCGDLPSTCTATVADYSTCINDQAAAYNQVVPGLAGCATVTRADLAAVWAFMTDESLPASCTTVLVNTCPGLDFPTPG
jgi:hypothetical protein